MPQLVDALDLVPLYVREQEEKEISDCAVKALLAVKSCVGQVARKYVIDSQALPNLQHTICFVDYLFDQFG